MPATINGVGTHYYGKRNLERYRGVCESCGRETELLNYETTLWFVVVFVPLVPLGKKQIFSDCTNCRRHRLMSAAQWKTVQEDSLRAQMATVSKSPDDAGEAVELLNLFVAFHRKEDAARLVEVLQQRFSEHPGVRLRLGAWYEAAGQAAVADSHFRRALELEPNNLAAKHAVVIGLLQEGNIEAAKRLLAAAPALTPQQDPSAYAQLAMALQQRNQHEEALAVYADLLEAVPEANRDQELRKRIRAAEQKSGRAGTMLSSVLLRERSWFWPALIGACVVLGLAYAEYHIFHHRTLHVVNGFARPVNVRLETGENVSVPPKSIRTLPMAEGSHQAMISAAGREEHATDFVVESGVFSRLFKSPAYVLNVDGGGVVVWEQTTYSVKPANDASEHEVKLHIGRPFVVVDDVDYIFTEFPESLQQKGSKTHKTRVGVEPIQPIYVLAGAPNDVPWDDRLSFAEAHLQMDGEDMELLAAYAHCCLTQNESPRCRSFLEAGLDRSPVGVNWHRAYQSFRKEIGDDETLVDEYQRRVDEDPKNANWLYLRGRIEPDYDASMALYERAIAADPRNAYPWFAKSFLLRNRGDFAAAKSACAEACRLNPADLQMSEALYILRLGAREAPAMERDLRIQWNGNPTSSEHLSKLLEVLALQNKKDEMTTTFRDFTARVRMNNALDYDTVVAAADLELQFLLDNYQAVLDRASLPTNAAGREAWNFIGNMALGRVDVAAANVDEFPAPQPFLELGLSMAWRSRGNTKLADEWQSRAVEHWADGDRDEQNIVAAFGRIPQMTFADAKDLETSQPYEKAILLTVLAQQCPADREKLLAEAEKQNFRRLPMQSTIAEAISSLCAKKKD